MGLDHGLNRKHYVKNWDFPSDRHNGWNVIVTKNKEPLPKSNLNPANVSYVVEEVVTWRKANAIHNWFVENVQGGKDDCNNYYVSLEQLKELLGLVNRVLDSSKLVKGKINNGYTFTKEGEKQPIIEDGQVIEDDSVAKELLPTTSGFFYGSTDYDEYYLEDLKQTKTALEQVINSDEGAEFGYWSSW